MRSFCPFRSAMEGCADSGTFSGRFEASPPPRPLTAIADEYLRLPGPLSPSAKSAVVRYTPLADVAVSQSASPLLLYRAADAADGSMGRRERERNSRSFPMPGGHGQTEKDQEMNLNDDPLWRQAVEIVAAELPDPFPYFTTVTCPRCKAPVGERCVVGGRGERPVHVGRGDIRVTPPRTGAGAPTGTGVEAATPRGHLVKRGPKGTMAAYLVQTPDLPRAACVGTDPSLWGTDVRETETLRTRDERVARAVEVCRSCPEVAPCRSWADSVRLYELNSIVVGATVRPSITGTKSKESNNE